MKIKSRGNGIILISITLISILMSTIVAIGGTNDITISGTIQTGVEGCKYIKGDDGRNLYLLSDKERNLLDGIRATITGTMVNPGYNICMVGDMLKISSIEGGWQLIDNNPDTRKIVTKGCNNCEPHLYQLHNDGTIWKFTGTPCQGNTCTGWELIDGYFPADYPKTKDIALDESDHIFKLLDSGAVMRYTGFPCRDNYCSWTLMETSSDFMSWKTIQIVGGGNYNIYRLRMDGGIMKMKLTGGWELLDNNPDTMSLATSGGVGYSNLFQLHRDGEIFMYTGTPLVGWYILDQNPRSTLIVGTGDYLYQMHFDGKIWKYTWSSGWKQLDNNPNTYQITAGGSYLYQLRTNGEIWRYINFD